MRERRQIIELWNRGDAVALVTLVRVEGSSYRRPGARLLIAANGDYAGSISGGCLEAEVIRKAQWSVRDGATLQRYSTLFDDTSEIPYGLGCGGTVDLLLEPAGTPECEALIAALNDTLEGHRRRITTQLPEGGLQLSRCVMDDCGAEVLFGSAGVTDAAMSCFDEWLEPPQRLILFGAGDDAQPMALMASLLGWRVIVIDSRSQWARPERFPQADAVLAAPNVGKLDLNGADAVVIMSHSYEQDRQWLAAVLPAGPRYLGLLGARHRSALLLSEVASMLGWSLDRACEGVFAPVGLDLGGDGAESIALATVSEIKACCEGKLGVSRRMTPDAVTEQIATYGASNYLQTQCAV